jgi:glycosyltransferase involved in cell wall biosynthesis
LEFIKVNNSINLPMVTVAMSVLNGGSFLRQAVQSVLEQSWQNWELLLIDDGSTDGAIQALTCLNDPRIRVINDGKNLGLSARLNQAIEIANGKYFARMDHDDICHPLRFAKQIGFLEKNTEIDLISAKCLTIDESGQVTGVLPSAINHSNISCRPWHGFYMPHPTWLGRSEWFRENLYQVPGPYCCEDQELLLRSYKKSRFHTYPEYLLAYRLRSYTPWEKQIRTRVAMAQMQIRFFIAHMQVGYLVLCVVSLVGKVLRDTLWRGARALPLNFSNEKQAEASLDWVNLSNDKFSADITSNQISEKPTVVFVVTTPFAVNSFLFKHILSLSESHDVFVCTNLSAYKLDERLFNIANVHHISFSRRISILADLICLFKLTAFLSRVSPIVVHSITPKAGLLAMLAGRLVSVPNRWHTFTGQVWATRKGFTRALLKCMDRLIAFCATKVFADSPLQVHYLSDEGVVHNHEIEIIGRGSIAGVDLTRFRTDKVTRDKVRERMDVATDICVFLFVGRLVKDKGIYDLISALDRVASSINKVELWVVGPDEEAILENLIMLAHEYKAPIKWLGATHEPEVYMIAADVMVLPSYREGFPSTIIEAAACKVPTIAYEIYGVMDAVVKDITGLLVEVGDVNAFADAMLSLSSNRELRLQLGQNAKDRVVMYFDNEYVTKSWVEYYRRYTNITL